MNDQAPNLYQYHDPIQFLRDWIGYLKEQKGYSLKLISKKSGISISNLSMLLNRQRPLTEKTFFKIASVLNLDAESRKFLNHLRIIDQSESQETRLESLSQILKITESKNIDKKSFRTFEYLTKWHHVAIYEFVGLQKFPLDPLIIQKYLLKKLTLTEINASLDFLKINKFIQLNESGAWVQTNPNLDCRDGVFKLSLAEFHRQMLNLASHSIDSISRNDRFIMGQTLSLSKSDFETIKKIIDKSIQEMNEANKNESEKDSIYHIEIAAFPLIKTIENQEFENEEA